MGFSQTSEGLGMMPKQRAYSIYLHQLNTGLVACGTPGLQQGLGRQTTFFLCGISPSHDGAEDNS